MGRVQSAYKECNHVKPDDHSSTLRYTSQSLLST